MEQRKLLLEEILDSRRPQERPWNPGCSMKTLNLCMEACPSLDPFRCSRSHQARLGHRPNERPHPWLLLPKGLLL